MTTTQKPAVRTLMRVAREISTGKNIKNPESTAIEHLVYKLIETEDKYQRLLDEKKAEETARMDRCLSSGIIGSLQILSNIVEDYAIYPIRSEAEKQNLITSIRNTLTEIERYVIHAEIQTGVPA